MDNRLCVRPFGSSYSYICMITLFFLGIQPIKQIWIFSCRQASTAIIRWSNSICLLILCGNDCFPIPHFRNLVIEQINSRKMPYIRGFWTVCSFYIFEYKKSYPDWSSPEHTPADYSRFSPLLSITFLYQEKESFLVRFMDSFSIDCHSIP